MRRTYKDRSEYMIDLYPLLSQLGNIYIQSGESEKAIACIQEGTAVLGDILKYYEDIPSHLMMALAYKNFFVDGVKSCYTELMEKHSREALEFEQTKTGATEESFKLRHPHLIA